MLNRIAVYIKLLTLQRKHEFSAELSSVRTISRELAITININRNVVVYARFEIFFKDDFI